MLSYGTIQMALNDVVDRDDIDEMELFRKRNALRNYRVWTNGIRRHDKSFRAFC